MTLNSQPEDAASIYGDGDWEGYLREKREHIEMQVQSIRQWLDFEPTRPDFLSCLRDPIEGEERQMSEASRLDQYRTFFETCVQVPQLSNFSARAGISAIQSYTSSEDPEGRITSLAQVMAADWEIREHVRSSQASSGIDGNRSGTFADDLTRRLKAVSLSTDSTGHNTESNVTDMDMGE
ncbi:hypothetical protein BCR39DRAFT_599215 [Naematelia encephala]|uniref:Uncharacterized protein n=1 Tax=Naematelia encephala TaxID=71784 RepID=A0A1Y2AZ83_9TREE|nr:hypothetical protein BCR39DRAFT_599215 [Naematelia encephala]